MELLLQSLYLEKQQTMLILRTLLLILVLMIVLKPQKELPTGFKLMWQIKF